MYLFRERSEFVTNAYKYSAKWNESGFRPPLCTYRLNWARRTSWGWWDDWDDTVLQTQDSIFEPWRSEAEHATSRSRTNTRRVLRILSEFQIFSFINTFASIFAYVWEGGGRGIFFTLEQYIYFSLCVEIYIYFTSLYIFLSTNLDPKLSLAFIWRQTIQAKRGFTNLKVI